MSKYTFPHKIDATDEQVDQDLAAGQGMWAQWAKEVENCGGQWAKSPLFVAQGHGIEAYRETAKYVAKLPRIVDPEGKTRDVEFGAIARDTCLGPCTRAWLDSQVEIDFIHRHLPLKLAYARVLDIGAGYGRLAVSMHQETASYTCTDGVMASFDACMDYCGGFTPEIMFTPALNIRTRPRPHPYELAINIHSWPECSLPQIEGWMDLLNEVRVPYLMVVPHGLDFSCWPHKGESFLPLLERDYAPIACEVLSMDLCLHTMWVRKEIQGNRAIALPSKEELLYRQAELQAAYQKSS